MRWLHLLPLVVTLPVGLAAPLAAFGGTSAGTERAATRVHIRVVIPAVVRLMENRFTRAPDTVADGSRTTSQRLVVSTNVRRGFCVDLHPHIPDDNRWRVRAVGGDPVRVEPLGTGWRVCGDRMGLHTVLLEHAFDGPVRPVRTDITLL